MKIESVEQYREALATIRRLRETPGSDDESPRLQALEAAAHDFANRMGAKDLEIGRPPRTERD